MSGSPTSHDAALQALREFGLSYPGAYLKSPWPEHLDLAVKDKIFAHLPADGQPFSISCKLPFTAPEALTLPFAQPTGYGLGKSGWVTAKIAPGDEVPLDLFKAWIDESYRSRAPKTLIGKITPP